MININIYYIKLYIWHFGWDLEDGMFHTLTHGNFGRFGQPSEKWYQVKWDNAPLVN